MKDDQPASAAPSRRMLVFDPAYTYDMLIERNLTAMLTSRDLDGFFDHLWTVHPFASLLTSADSPARFGRPLVHELDPRNTMIEGKVGRYAGLAWFPALNFFLAQLDVMRLLLRVVREQRIGIIRSDDAWYCGGFALIVARLRRLPLIVGVWGNPGEMRRSTGKPVLARLFRFIWIEEMVERFVLRRADRVMSQNEDNRRFVLSTGVLPAKSVIFRLGNALADVHFSDPATRGSGQADLDELNVGATPSLLVISRLEPLKLVDHVVRCVKILADRGRRVVVLFVGDGQMRPELEQLAARLGIADQVIFCGNRDQAWLARVIPVVTMVVSPLTGRALGEAALGGAPMVAYDIDWQSELVETGKTGELVPHLDQQAMAGAIERLIDDPIHARTMGANLRIRALNLLDRGTAQRFQQATYQELLGK